MTRDRINVKIFLESTIIVIPIIESVIARTICLLMLFGLWNAVWFYSEAPPLITVNFTQGSAASGTVTADIQFIVQSPKNFVHTDCICE